MIGTTPLGTSLYHTLSTPQSMPLGPRSYVTYRAPVQGGTTRGGLGSLGMEVNLFKLGGLSGLGLADEEVAAAIRFREAQYRAALDRQDRAQQRVEQQEAIDAAKDAAERSYEAQQSILSSSEVQLKETMRRVGSVAVIGLIAFLGFTALTGREKKRKS